MVFISRSELLFVAFSIALVFSELLLQHSLHIRGVTRPATSAELTAFFVLSSPSAWPRAATT
eukprot:1336080-Pyramimonas_sp.AAC.1